MYILYNIIIYYVVFNFCFVSTVVRILCILNNYYNIIVHLNDVFAMMLNNRIANINKNGNYILKYPPILLWYGASARIPFDEQIKKINLKECAEIIKDLVR